MSTLNFIIVIVDLYDAIIFYMGYNNQTYGN